MFSHWHDTQRFIPVTGMNHPTPSLDDTEDLLLSCRYGDIDDFRSFLERFGTAPISHARDENENTVLHMAAANGHVGQFVLTYDSFD
jgi:ankyrin repeat protein